MTQACSTEAILLRNFCFSLVTQRHFAKVLNLIDVGIAGDRLESSLLQLKVFVPSYSFHFVLFFCCESADVDLEYFCCPVWMVCWSLFCFPWRCPVLFRLGSLVSLCHVRLVSIVGRCWLLCQHDIEKTGVWSLLLAWWRMKRVTCFAVWRMELYDSMLGRTARLCEHL